MHTATQQTDNSAHRGVFVTFEGVDGAGKSTQCALVCAGLAMLGRTVERLREPGGCAVGERVRAVLLDPGLSGMDPVCELLLYEAARAQLVAEVIRPALLAGSVVVSDRFYDSTMAYQGFARGLGAQGVQRANALACGEVTPDRTVLLDLDPRGAYERATASGADRLEQEGESFQERVREGFLHVARQEPGRVRVIDARGTVGEVYERVRQCLADLVELPSYEQVRHAV